MPSSVRAGSPSSAAVPVGGYRLELGSADGTFALFEPEAEREQARAVAEALASSSRVEEPPAGDGMTEELLADAATVTERAQRCLTLFTEIAGGHALDLKSVSDELDGVLALVGRLDREGQHKEALRLARDVSALLALLLRWLDLVRSLELSLRLARELGDAPTEAWALHELGTLRLATGDATGAADELREAVRIKDRFGGAGRCASRHNLDAARRDLADRDALDRLRRRRLFRLTGIAAVLAFLATGGVALGIRLSSHHHPIAASTVQSKPSTAPHTSPPTTVPPTASVIDTTAPMPTLSAPTGLIDTATPDFVGAAGDATGDATTVTITILNSDGNEVAGSPLVATRSGTTFSVTATTPLADGTYTATVVQTDEARNTHPSAPIAFTVDTTPPAVTLTCNLPTCNGTATELDQLVTVTVIDDGPVGSPPTPGTETSQTVTVEGDHTFKVTVATPAPSEQYDIVATQRDAAGNVSPDATVHVETPSAIR